MTQGSHAQVPVRLFATATATIVLGLYAAQPMVGRMAVSLHLSPAAAGLVSTLVLLGYALGLFVLVPLCDLVENRLLVLSTLGANVAALGVAACPVPVPLFLTAVLFAGLTASAIQMLVPMAAAMTAPQQRGRVIGRIMSGLVLGVMLSRPLASVIEGQFGWRGTYAVLAVIVAGMTIALAYTLPRRQPRREAHYGVLLASMATLLRDEPLLRRKAVSAALCFAAFNAFWSMVALRLAAAPFHLGADGIALFALAGVSGAVVAPLAGHHGDSGREHGATRMAHAGIVLAVLLAWLAGHGGMAPVAALALLVLAAVLLDAGTIADQALGRRAVNLLNPEARGRINGLFTGVFFIGGAAGSACAGMAWAHAGWNGVCLVAAAFGVAALLSGARTGVPMNVVVEGNQEGLGPTIMGRSPWKPSERGVQRCEE